MTHPGPDLSSPASTASARGRILAERYRLEEPVGSGGMATVWRAEHVTLGQPLAIKFIEVAGMNADRLRDRFLREARVAAAIRHRNVVHILDFGTSPDGVPFMAMELLEGETLATRMTRQPPMTVGETVRVIAQLLSGLGAVHDAGILHRDLKPENVFLVRDADGSYPKLIDFGVSRALDPRAGVQSVLPTMENAIAGTPQYMSPEQARGLADLDHRSDLWSAGVILFELLTGRLPYDGDAAGDVMIQIATADPPDFAALRPDLRGPIEDVVKRSMAKDPAQRFQSARAMRAALLAAVRSTASRLGAIVDRDPIETADDVTPAALLEAVGDSYEPGDSGLIDMSSQLDVIDTLFPPPSHRILDAPPPAPALGADPFASADRGDTLEDAPAAGRGRWLLLGGAAIAAIASVGLVALWLATRPAAPEISVTELEGAARPAPPSSPEVAPVPEPAGPARVTLEGVPAGATILLDDAPWEAGPTLEVPRDGSPHEVEVRTGDGRSWRVEHRAEGDATYTVELPARAPRPTAPPSTRRRGDARSTGGSDLIRNPGF